MIVKRIVSDIALLFALIVFPWWVSLPFALILAFYFEHFYEMIFAGLFLDFLESSHSLRFFGFSYIFTLVCLVLFFLFRFAKTKLSFPKF